MLSKQGKYRVIMDSRRNSKQKSRHLPTVLRESTEGRMLLTPKKQMKSTGELMISTFTYQWPGSSSWAQCLSHMQCGHTVNRTVPREERGCKNHCLPLPCLRLSPHPQAHFCSIMTTSHPEVSCWMLHFAICILLLPPWRRIHSSNAMLMVCGATPRKISDKDLLWL